MLLGLIAQSTVQVPSVITPTMFTEIGHGAVSLWPTVYSWLKIVVNFFVVISIPLSLFFLIGIIYCVEQLKLIRDKEKKKHDIKIEPAFEDVKGNGNKDLTVRWQKVNSLMNSDNLNDWKQAILEADNMLLDILVGLGYQGDGVGEKLKRVQSGDFKSIEDAWEAHKVRNQIAHESGFVMTHHVAMQTIHRYRRVFEEFYYI